jgi:hypothetical protein
MARYTGPKLELLVNLAKQYSEMIKHSKEEVTHLDNTDKRGKKNLCYPVNGEAKLNILMDFRKQFRGLFKKHQLLKVLLVKFYYNYVKQD